MTYYFSDLEEAEIAERFKNGVCLGELGTKFKCSGTPIRRILIEKNGKREYLENAKEHLKHSGQKSAKIFLKEEKVEIVKKYKKGISGNELAQKFRCSGTPIGKILIRILGLENYKKIAKEHSIKNSQNIGLLPKTEKQLKNYVSRPEQAFFDLLCSQNPNLIIKQQQYLKGLNHAFDIMIPELKILIEVDGDYTHSRPGRKERDAEINEFIWRTYPDWQLFRYCDEDLRKLGIIK